MVVIIPKHGRVRRTVLFFILRLGRPFDVDICGIFPVGAMPYTAVLVSKVTLFLGESAQLVNILSSYKIQIFISG